MKKDSLIPIIMIAFLSAFIFITIPKAVEKFSNTDTDSTISVNIVEESAREN